MPNIKAIYVDRVNKFSLDVDEASGDTFVGIPVANQMTDYIEWYRVEKDTFEKYKADPTLALDFVGKAKRREIDHLLLLKPGRDRGTPI